MTEQPTTKRWIDRWLLSVSWRATLVQFLLFALLFSLYDATVFCLGRDSQHGVSLVNYVVRDDRTDESAMYMSAIRDMIDGHFKSTDPYLVEHRSEPTIRPKLPVWIAYLLSRVVTGTNALVWLLHTLAPAIGAVLLVRLFAIWVSPGFALLLAVGSVGGAVYSTNIYLEWLRLVDLMGPFSYNPERHLLGGYFDHIRFNRFFSPGLTLPLLLVWLLPLVGDPDLRRRRSLAWFGIGLGVQMYVYPHAALFLVLLGGGIIALSAYTDWRGNKSAAAVGWDTARRAAWLALCAGLAALPYLRQSMLFNASQHAGDIMSRIGFSDEFGSSVRTPIFCCLLVALIFKLAAQKSNRLRALSAGEATADSARDRLWWSLFIACGLSVWLAGMLAYWAKFPQAWLLPARIVSYFVPVVVGYPLVQWLGSRPRGWLSIDRIQPYAWRAAAAYAVLLAFGEISSAKNNFGNYQLHDELADFRRAVDASTASDSTVLTENLWLAAWLVCETDRNSFIAYGASSNASNRELIERFMLASVLQGRSFNDFFEHRYLGFNGLPGGPSGEHWTLHHGSVDLQLEFSEKQLGKIYRSLVRLPAGELLRRYHCDYLYLPRESIALRFQQFMEPTSERFMQRIIGDSAVGETEIAVEPSDSSDSPSEIAATPQGDAAKR